MAKNSLSLPDNLVQLLSAADQAKHFPPGTMASLLQQEVGGDVNRYVSDPTAPHYAADASGKRKSTAFGPFGLLESTAADPGYGVAPLKNKADLAEHVRFASDYLDARSKSAGSLDAGLAGYGEGQKYATQVARRRDNTDVVAAPAAPAPVPVAPPPVVLASAPAVVSNLPPAPLDPAKDPWTQYRVAADAAMTKQFTPADLDYGKTAAPVRVAAPAMPLGPADYQALLAQDVGNKANFGMFQGLGRLGRRSA